MDDDDPAFRGLCLSAADAVQDITEGDGDDEDTEDVEEEGSPATAVLEAEGIWVTSVQELGEMIGLASVNICAGRVIMATIPADPIRHELRGQLDALHSAEVIVPDACTAETLKCLQDLVQPVDQCNDDSSKYIKRVVRLPPSRNRPLTRPFLWASDLPSVCQNTLTNLEEYLTEFHLEGALANPAVTLLGVLGQLGEQGTNSKTSFDLDSVTIRDLEVFEIQNKQEKSSKNKAWGSLLWVIDHCKTSYGRRNLKSWLSSPLLRRADILARQELVKWLSITDVSRTTFVRCCTDIFQSFGDIERQLASLQFNRISLSRMKVLFQFGNKVGKLQEHLVDNTACPSLLHDWLKAVNWAAIAQQSQHFSNKLISCEAEAEASLSGIFTAAAEVAIPELVNLSAVLHENQRQLAAALDKARIVLRMPGLQFSTLRSGANSKTEHLLELPIKFAGQIPDNWLKVSATKQVNRFHTPDILSAQDALYHVRDEIKYAGERHWQAFAAEVKDSLHELLRNAVQSLANIDIAISLAVVAQYPGYVCPVYSEQSDEVTIEHGKHPVLSRILEEEGSSFVPNDVHLRRNFHPRMCQVISGPNMGGKSSYVRMIAQICLLGQIGSFVPAQQASLCVFDNIFTRMGAEDDLSTGRSTFMCELMRTSNILHRASSKSLVIVDELGRGTSTYDGCAIALATLKHIVRTIGCMTLFITHFPEVAKYADSVTEEGLCCNGHMSYVEAPGNEVVFLYKLVRHRKTIVSLLSNNKHMQVEGASRGSYGINIARLAGMPAEVLQKAADLSAKMLAQASFIDIAMQARKRKR